MLSINNLSFYIGNRVLYDEVNLHIKPKDKIGLVGANGTGKSTLLRLIDGEYTPDEGTISKSGDCTLGFLNQDLLSFQSDDPILKVAMEAFQEAVAIQNKIDELIKELESNYQEKTLDELTKLQERYEALEGYTLQANAEKILEGLGFSSDDLHKPLRQFSGGWRMRVMLAKMLLSKPSLLMLDEPTNHLDLPSIQWLENYISNYEGAVIIVSHDRYFLDKCIKTIVEVSQSKLNIYSGNYSFYLKEKEERQIIQQNAFENQQSQIKQAQRFIDRFKAKATKARQVQSKIKMLDKIDLIEEVVDESAKVHFKFSYKTEPGRHLIQLKNVSKAYGDLKILENTSINIEKGDKIALIGANGKGKSTLLRIIANTEPIEGESITGHNVIMSFFAQHQMESLNLENEILQELKETGSDKTETELRSILGCFLFSSDDVFKKIKVLSGGEKSRVAMAKTLLSNANFLMLDEPTNHLDIQSVNILIQALKQYQGTYICISHDRHFVSEVANKIWYIEDCEIKEYPGTYQEFMTWKTQRELENDQINKQNKVTSKTTEKKDNRTNNPNKNEIKKLKKTIQETENKIAEIELIINGLNELLAKPETWSEKSPEELENIQNKQKQNKEALAQNMELWENALVQLENLENE